MAKVHFTSHKGKPAVDVRWPDGLRSRIHAENAVRGKQIVLQVQLSFLQGNWASLRDSLVRSKDHRIKAWPAALTKRRFNLQEFQLPIVPSCVYFLCLGDEVVYIGQTTNLVRRIITHTEDDKKLFDRVFYIVVPKKQLTRMETRFIAELRPKLNHIRVND